jgi:Flp pilus assembly protein TadG
MKGEEMMRKKRDLKRSRGKNQGQALVEFALILPLLLLLLAGIIDFSYILTVYVSLANAAREGVRYGIVSPSDYQGINDKVREKIALVPPEEVAINVMYDSGPGTGRFVDPAAVAVGGRVVVQVDYDVSPLTGLIQVLIPEPIHFSVESNRTIQSVRTAGGPPQQAPTPTPLGGATATPTPVGGGDTPVPTDTPVPPGSTATPTPTPLATSTPTVSPTPTPLPIIISKPVMAGETRVEGTAKPSESIILRITNTGYEQPGTVDANGDFVFDGVPTLVAGQTVVVTGYGQQDLTIVEGGTVTPTPTPTPDTSTAYIEVDPTCTSVDGLQMITVQGFNWPTDNSIDKVELFFDGASQREIDYGNSGTFETTINVLVTEGEHVIEAYGKLNDQVLVIASTTFIRPCPATPTPSPTPTPTPGTQPDFVVTNLSLLDEPPLGTYEELSLSVAVQNQGAVDATSLSWVELYVDGDPDGVDSVAIDGLLSGESINFTMYVPEGVDTTGQHTLVAVADTLDQVVETDEANNTSAPLVITVTVDNPMPTPTPVLDGKGTLLGTTYLDGVEQGNVTVKLYDESGVLVVELQSEFDGSYVVSDLPAGDYVVVGEMRIGDVLYRAQVGPVQVKNNKTTTGVDLNLQAVTP